MNIMKLLDNAKVDQEVCNYLNYGEELLTIINYYNCEYYEGESKVLCYDRNKEVFIISEAWHCSCYDLDEANWCTEEFSPELLAQAYKEKRLDSIIYDGITELLNK